MAKRTVSAIGLDASERTGDWISDEEPATFTPTDGAAAATDEEPSTNVIWDNLDQHFQLRITSRAR
jgi:hypothetical protein